MQKLLPLLAAVLFSLTVKANATLEQLLSVNKNWIFYQDAVAKCNGKQAKNESSFLSHEAIIKEHLQLVHTILSEKSTAHLSEKAKANRKTLLVALSKYAAAGQFPKNIFLPFTNPVFIDDEQTHCAVGYLMQQSGAEALAQEINNTERFDYIKEISNHQVPTWAEENGFTLAELAWIQPAYAAMENMGKVEDGVNGAINCIVKIDANNYIIGGDFTKELKGNTTCNHLASLNFQNGVWKIAAMQNGVNGSVHALFLDGSKIIIGGKFNNANGVAVQNIATYDLLSSSQPFAAMGALDSTVRCIIKYDNKIFAGGAFTNIFKVWQNNVWQTLPFSLVDLGEVRTMEVFNNELYIGGNFELLTGALRKHIAIYDAATGYFKASHMGNKTPVNDFCIFNNELYAGCDFVDGTDTCYMSKLGANNWDVLPNNGYMNGSKIKRIIVKDNSMYTLGQFTSTGMMSFGNNICKVTPQGSNLMYEQMLTIDNAINDGIFVDDKLLLVGDFVNNTNSNQPPYTQTLNKIGYISMGPSALPIVAKNEISLFPNPSTNAITISGSSDLLAKAYRFQIINVAGQVVKSDQLKTEKINIQELPIGSYQLLLDMDGIQKSARFFKY